MRYGGFVDAWGVYHAQVPFFQKQSGLAMFVTLSCFNERLSEFPMSDRDKQKQMHHDAFEKNGTGALQTPQASTNPVQSVDPGTLLQSKTYI